MAYITGEVGAIGFASLAVALLGFIRFFLVRQIADLRADVLALNEKVDGLEAKYDEQRGLKHKAYNDVTKAVMALAVVQRLASDCTCGALKPVIEIVNRLVADLETLGNRRADDPEGVTP